MCPRMAYQHDREFSAVEPHWFPPLKITLQIYNRPAADVKSDGGIKWVYAKITWPDKEISRDAPGYRFIKHALKNQYPALRYPIIPSSRTFLSVSDTMIGA